MLVLLGHLMRGMASGGIIPAEGVYTWFDQTVYYFHVPLFLFAVATFIKNSITSIVWMPGSRIYYESF